MYEMKAAMPTPTSEIGLCAQLDQLAAHLEEHHKLLDGIVPRDADKISEVSATVRGVVNDLQASAIHLTRRLVQVREALGDKWPL